MSRGDGLYGQDGGVVFACSGGRGGKIEGDGFGTADVCCPRCVREGAGGGGCD